MLLLATGSARKYECYLMPEPLNEKEVELAHISDFSVCGRKEPSRSCCTEEAHFATTRLSTFLRDTKGGITLL